MSIRYKIIALFLVATLLPFITIALLIYTDFSKSIEKSSVDRLVILSQIQKSRVEYYLQKNHNRLIEFNSRVLLKSSVRDYLKTKNPESLMRIITSITDAKAGQKDYKDIHILDLKGTVIASTKSVSIGTHRAKEPFFVKGLVSNNISELFLGEDKKPRQYLTGPIYINDEKIGVTAIELDMRELFDLFHDYTWLGETGDWGISVGLDNGDGLVVVPLRIDTDPNSPLTKVVSKKLTKTPVIRTLNARRALVLTDSTNYLGTPIYAATQYIPQTRWQIGIIMDKSETTKAARVLFNQLMFFAVLMALFIVFMGMFLSQIIVAPILTLSIAAKRIAAGDFSQLPTISSNDEIGQLAKTFNLAVETIQKNEAELNKVDKAKDEFLSIAAHQLRTPLGVTRWTLEGLLSNSNIHMSASLKKTLQELYDNNLGLIGLVNGLLDVSRINAGRVEDRASMIDPAQEISMVVDLFKNDAAQKKVTIAFTNDWPAGRLVLLDPKLLKQVVENLVSNAVKYNRPKGTVEVVLAGDASSLILVVRDTGTGIAPADHEKLFTKFYRSTGAQNSDVEGTGLGLFVVKSYIVGGRV